MIPFIATRKIAQSAEEETETDNIDDSNLQDDSDYGDEGAPDGPISDYLDEWE